MNPSLSQSNPEEVHAIDVLTTRPPALERNNPPPTILYLRLPSNDFVPVGEHRTPHHGTPIGALAYTIVGNTLEIGLSINSGLDRWNRERAREIAVNRLNRKRTTRTRLRFLAEEKRHIMMNIPPMYYSVELPPSEVQRRPFDVLSHIVRLAAGKKGVKFPRLFIDSVKTMLMENDHRQMKLIELKQAGKLKVKKQRKSNLKSA